MGTQVKSLKPGRSEKNKIWDALPRIGLPQEQGLGWFWHDMVPTVTCRVKTLEMACEKLLFAFSYQIIVTTTNNFRGRLWTVREQHLLKQAENRKHCLPLPQWLKRFLKAVRESWATQAWGAGHTLQVSDLQMTFTALHFHFPKHRFRGSYLLFHVKTVECHPAAKAWFPFPDINHFALTLYQRKN